MALAESIERLDSMPEFLDTAIDIVPREHLAFRPREGAFSLVEHACHLRDLEREGYLVRVRRMIGETRPALQGFDGAAVAKARDYLAQDAKLAASEFAAARREVLGLLAPLTEADLAREATFQGEPIAFRDIVAMMVEHDREHRAKIGELMDAIERQ